MSEHPLPTTIEEELGIVHAAYPEFLSVFLEHMTEGHISSFTYDACFYGDLAQTTRRGSDTSDIAIAIQTELYGSYVFQTPIETLFEKHHVHYGDTVVSGNPSLVELDTRIRAFLAGKERL